MESLYKAWGPFNKELLHAYPHHKTPTSMLMQIFCTNLSDNLYTTINATAGVTLMGKSQKDLRIARRDDGQQLSVAIRENYHEMRKC